MVNEKGMDEETIMRRIRRKSRDHARTPMQWDDSRHAGFTSGTPWLPVHPDYREVNVKRQLDDPNSVLHYYRKLIRFRKEHPIVVYGAFDIVLPDHDQIFAYTRRLAEECWLVLLNFSGDNADYELPASLAPIVREGERFIGNYPDESESRLSDSGRLRPYEAVVYRKR